MQPNQTIVDKQGMAESLVFFTLFARRIDSRPSLRKYDRESGLRLDLYTLKKYQTLFSTLLLPKQNPKKH